MKKQTGIWIDSKKAVLVTLENGKEKTNVIESNLENRIYHNKEGDKGSFIGAHHYNNEKKFEERKKQQLSNYFKDITTQISASDKVFIFGPAETKTRLKHEIENNKTLKSKLTGVEASDKITMNQIVAKTKEHFKL